MHGVHTHGEGEFDACYAAGFYIRERERDSRMEIIIDTRPSLNLPFPLKNIVPPTLLPMPKYR